MPARRQIPPLFSLFAPPPYPRNARPGGRPSGGSPARGGGKGGGDRPACSCLQLALQFVEKAPIGVLGDDILRNRFDPADFMQAQRIVTDRVLGIVFPPFVVGNIA